MKIRYEELDTNDQLTGGGKTSADPLPDKAGVGPGENYWLPLERETIDLRTTGPWVDEDQPYTVDLPGQRVVWTTTLRDQTAQEIDDDADGFFNRIVSKDKPLAVVVATFRDFIMQERGISETAANNWLRTTMKEHFKNL